MEQQDREAMKFGEMVQRAVNVEAKAGLKSSAMVQDSDIRYLRGYRPSSSIAAKVQTQGTFAKEPHPEEFKTKEAKLAKGKAPALLRINVVESSEQGKKDRKDKKWRFRERRKWSEDTPATSHNTIDASKKKKKNRDCDISRVTCYNYNKKGHFANICTEPKN